MSDEQANEQSDVQVRSNEPLTEVMERIGKGTRASTDQGNATATPWIEACRRFGEGGWFWLATVAPDGAPHVMPVFAAWDTSAFFVASKQSTVKSRNLAAEGRCVVSKDAGDLHLVVEGIAQRVLTEAGLERASAAFESVYGWATAPTDDDELDADYGAPTSGGPPYQVWQIVPTKAFGFPTDGESFTPTRWRFPAGAL